MTMACRADRMDWRDATPSFGDGRSTLVVPRPPAFDDQRSTDHTVLADTLLADILAPLSAALAPADAGRRECGNPRPPA